MKDRDFIKDFLVQQLDEIEPLEFYRSIFPKGELEEAGKLEKGKYSGIAVELLPPPENDNDKRSNVRRYLIKDDLEKLKDLLQHDNFIIISPISYAGMTRQSVNARFIYALAIDLDGITEEHYLLDFFYQIDNEIIPKPTYIVWSGSGLHLYYQFIKPIPCFKNIVTQLADLKKDLTRKIWNGYVTELAEQPQIESLFQGFRLVGGVTKGGSRSRVFDFGEKVDIEYLNNFVSDEAKVTEFKYKSDLTLKEAAAAYPDWYEKRIIKKQKRGTWQANRAVYDWWLRELKQKIVVGHRYYGIMVLAVYAKKCGIPREELEEDAFSLVNQLDLMTIDDNNHFTRQDVLAALEMFDDNYITFPIDTIKKLTAIDIKKNKRNYRKREMHLEIARYTKELLKKSGKQINEGRPSKRQDVIRWRQLHPKGSRKECMEDLKISRSTVSKYWKEEIDG